MSLSTRVVTITPQKAAEMLASNSANRPPKGAAIKRYAEDMREGRWVTNGEAIIIRDDGVLLNGQNRLLACIEADVSFETLVVTGIAPAALDSIDIGQSRSLADQLHWRGVSNAATVAATTKWGWRYDDMVKHGRRQLGPFQKPRDVELAYFDKHRRYLDAASATLIGLRKRIPGPQSHSMFVHFLVHRFAGLDKADAFYNAVAYDSEGETGAPALLKEWLLARTTIGSRPTPTQAVAIQIKAARFWLAGEEPKQLLWKRAGKRGAEAFPRIDGPAWGKTSAEAHARAEKDA